MLAAAGAGCGTSPAPRSAPAPRYNLAFEPSHHEDTPCTAQHTGSLLNALHTRVYHRLVPPLGFVVVLPDGPQTGAILQSDVRVSIHPGGRILNAEVTKSSSVPTLDQSIIVALKKAACMPAPPKELLDPSSNSMRIQVSYRFRKVR